MARKLYTGLILDVSFDGEICQSAAECVRGMPEVYDTSKRLWINAEYANTDKLREMTRRCPGSALQLFEHELAE